jgi:hypothetical protein
MEQGTGLRAQAVELRTAFRKNALLSPGDQPFDYLIDLACVVGLGYRPF